MENEKLFNRLWLDYTGKNPLAEKIFNLFIAEGETVLNDHIAFRTFDDKRVNVDVLSKVFIKAGFTEKGTYFFKEKHLFAKHFEHNFDDTAPKIFISELLTSELSPFVQTTAKMLCDSIHKDLLNSEELILSGRLWGIPSYEIFEKLRKESEYAAWLYVNGFTVNHFTVNVNTLKKYDTIQKVNSFLKKNGYLINDAGGEIQGTPLDLLEQSSVKAELKNEQFQEGIYEVTGCYYEFAKRYTDEKGRLYSGFIAKSADKIFQSTDLYKKKSIAS